jgi:deoxyribodipyrimidine photolyase-related protein
MKCLVLFPHQLYEFVPPDITHIYLIEHPMFFKLYHKLRIAHTRACMKKYWDYLSYLSYLKHQTYIEWANYKKFIDDGVLLKYQQIIIYDPIDIDIEKEFIKTFREKLYIEYNLPNFLLARNEFPTYYRHSAFYKYIKHKLDILKTTPNLDKHNRFKLPKNIKIPDPLVNNNNKYYQEACEYVGGDVNIDILRLYPIDFATSKQHFERFLSTKLENYGKYQDAIVSSDTFVFHSNISALLNNGLLTPAYVIKKVLAVTTAPMNSKEGFIRQVLGWREYMRYVYYHINPRDEAYSQQKYNRIDWKAWTLGTTGIEPLDNEIKKCIKYAYAHHIVRLMIFLNMFILMRIHPQDIYKWFMSCCSIDAYPWVMYSNIYGMGWFDRRFTHKAYISSSNYILKMSDYKRGPWCQKWDDLYRRRRQ